MKKVNFVIIMILMIFTFLGCSTNNYENNIDTITKEQVENIILGYLDALSRKDIDDLQKFGTQNLIKIFDDEGIEILRETLKSTKLLKCELKESDNKRALVYAEVEVICYEDALPIGDWIPGKTISNKSFELLNIYNKWKVNGWGVY